jgi:hypothetical protein
LAVNAGDAFLSIHPELASNFGRQLVSQVQSPVTRAGEQASHHFARSMGHGLATTGKLIGAGIAGGLGLAVVAAVKLTPVLKQSVQGYRDHLKVVAQTSAAIKSTGGAANVSVKQVGKLSDALERKTTVDGDVIQSGQNMLLTFTNIRNETGKGRDIFNQASVASLDMAAAFGHGKVTADGLQSASVQLGKALNDPVKGITALSRVGVTFNDQQKKRIAQYVKEGDLAKAQGVILAEVNKEFGGSAAAQATAAGRMQVAWHQLQDTIGSVLLPVVDRFENSLGKKLIPDINVLATRWGPAVTRTLLSWVDHFTRLLPSTKELGYGITALGAAFHGEGITSSAGSFVGKMERLGVTGRAVVDWARNFGPLLGRIGSSFTKLFQSSSQVGPALQQAGGGGHMFANSLLIIGPILDVVARNLHNILPWLPAILAGFLAFRALRNVTQPLVQIGELISNIAAPFRIAALFAQNRALKAHTAALVENTGAITGNTVATELSTGATNVGVVASIRARAATIGQAIASKAAAVASKGLTVATWLLSAAQRAMPIVLIISLIAALAAGIIYAYKHSETFRKIVQGAFNGVKTVIGLVVTSIIASFRAWFNIATTVVGGIIHVFGKLPGPLGAPFRKAEQAVRDAKKTVNDQLDKIQARVNRLTGKDIPVTASLKLNFSKSFTQADWAQVKVATRGASGGLVIGPGGPTADRVPALLSNGEFVVNAAAVRQIGIENMKRLNAMRFAAGGVVGTIDAEARGINKLQARGTGIRMDRGLTKLLKAFGGGSGRIKAFIRAADSHPYIWGGVGPGGWDCSGLTGSVFALMRHRNPYRRYFTTSSNFGALGFKPGPGGVYTIGVNPVIGHMAGRYGGLAFEAANTRAGIRVGNAARSVSTFPAQYHLASGGLVGDLAGWLAEQPGIAIGGDPAKLRIERYDRGGFLPPGRLALNTTGRPEALGFDYDKLGKAVADALREQPPRVAVDDMLAADARMSRRLGGVSRS